MMEQIFLQTYAILFKDPRSFRLVHRMKNGFVQMLSQLHEQCSNQYIFICFERR
jgi:hypothetical protein